MRRAEPKPTEEHFEHGERSAGDIEEKPGPECTEDTREVLGCGANFGEASDRRVDRLPSEQLEDG